MNAWSFFPFVKSQHSEASGNKQQPDAKNKVNQQSWIPKGRWIILQLWKYEKRPDVSAIADTGLGWFMITWIEGHFWNQIIYHRSFFPFAQSLRSKEVCKMWQGEIQWQHYIYQACLVTFQEFIRRWWCWSSTSNCPVSTLNMISKKTDSNMHFNLKKNKNTQSENQWAFAYKNYISLNLGSSLFQCTSTGSSPAQF